MWLLKYYLLIIIAITLVGIAFKRGNSQALNSGVDLKPLELTTSIMRERYCSDSGSMFLEWILKLQYTNRSDRTVLLDKNSYRVTRTLVSLTSRRLPESNIFTNQFLFTLI